MNLGKKTLRTIIVATGNPDVRNEILDLKGIRSANKVYLLKNFDKRPENILGIVERVWVDGNYLKAEIELPPRDIGHLTPAISFTGIEVRQKGRKKIFKKWQLHSIGLCECPNSDPYVQCINLQIGNVPRNIPES